MDIKMPLCRRFATKHLKKAGEGSYGAVYIDKNVAVKVMPWCQEEVEEDCFGVITAVGETRTESVAVPRWIMREVATYELLRALPHPNLLQCLEMRCCTSLAGTECIITMPQAISDLGKYLRKHSRILASLVRQWVLDILRGLEHMHGIHMVHRDLKPANILLFRDPNRENPYLRIADFNSVRFLDDHDYATDNQYATRWYRSPERLLGARTDSPADDMWALGCVVAEVITGKPCFPGESEIDTIFRIFRCVGTPHESKLPFFSTKFPKWPPTDDPALKLLGEGLPHQWRTIVNSLLRWDPAQRPTSTQLLDKLEDDYFWND